uniref:site-specific DNA-methyltransferase (adenine-specific) n=1 Tax=Marinitoga okinawensis TaxID=389480 RepID=A0A9C7GWD2_9BACT|nr:N-6 DNA methylase [Marinitoga okinawensis]CAI4093957.1 Type I restriction modification system, DNA methyltransferase subunit M and specificity subunit S [Marinitoga okinawensis]
MATKNVDFHKLGDELWKIANIFRDDSLKTTEYLEEFSYFLFLKLFDDQEKQREEAARIDGNEYIPYLPEELRFYTWANEIINGDITINEVVPTVRKIFQDLANIEDHNGKDLSLFRRLFRNHIWRIKYGPTIRDLLKKLIDLKLEQNFDVMGRAYEFVVQKLGEQKQYGQYFTPRHIIHFMVDLADPEIGEKIYDPAVGTGGFILRAFEVVKKKIYEKYENDYFLVEKYFRELKEKNLWGIEKAPDVYKLALMNMILHNDGKSNLYEADSLDNRAQDTHKQKYDVVLSNPPYGPLTQSRVGIFEYHVKRFEALFIQHIMNSLKFSSPDKKNSRAVVIILDKILFDNSNTFKNIRKKLLREFNLKAIISMPAGIFHPYSGVKTTILYFERPTNKEWNEIKSKNDYATKYILFFDVKNDGFTLSTQRKPINGAFQGNNPNIYNPPCGDLPDAISTFKEWIKTLDNDNIDTFKEKYVDNKQVWIANIDEIKRKDYNLNPGLYRNIEKRNIKWKWVKLGDILEKYSVRNKEKKLLPVYSITKEQGIILADKYFKENVYGKNNDTYEKNLSQYKVIEKGCFVYNPYRINIGSIGYFDIPKKGLVSPAYVVFKVKNKDKVDELFLFNIFKSDWFLSRINESTSGSIRDSLSFELLSQIHIPLPPLEVQKQIVERLKKQRVIIEKSKELEKIFLDTGIDNAIFKGNWKFVELNDIVTFAQYGISSRADGTEEDIPILGMNNLTYIGEIDLSSLKYIKLDKDKLEKYKLEKGDILFNRTNSKTLIGKTAIFDIDGTYVFASYLIRLRVNKDKVLPKFVSYYMNSKLIKEYIQTLCREIIGQANINLQELKSIKISIPPLEKQQEIIEILDSQFEALDKIRKMRENAEIMIKAILEKEVFAIE